MPGSNSRCGGGRESERGRRGVNRGAARRRPAPAAALALAAVAVAAVAIALPAGGGDGAVCRTAPPICRTAAAVPPELCDAPAASHAPAPPAASEWLGRLAGDALGAVLPPAEAATCSRIADAYIFDGDKLVITYTRPVDIRYDHIRPSTDGTISRAHCTGGDNRAACYDVLAHHEACYVQTLRGPQLSGSGVASCNAVSERHPWGGREILSVQGNSTFDLVTIGTHIKFWEDYYYSDTGYRSTAHLTDGTTARFSAVRTGGDCFPAGTYTARDALPPSVDRTLEPTLDLAAGQLKFRSTEPLSGTALPGTIRIAGVTALDAASRVSVSRGTDVTVALTPGDHDLLNSRLARASTDTFKTVNLGLHDYSGNAFHTGRWWQTFAIVHDNAAPTLQYWWLDFNTGVLTLRFNEAVHWIYTPYVYLEDPRGGNRHSLASATAPSSLRTATVELTIPPSLLETLGDVHRGHKTAQHTGLRLDLLRGATADNLNNRFAGLLDREIGVTEDSVAPRIASGTAPALDMARHTLALTFDERIDVSESNAGRIKVANSTDHVYLQGGSVGGRDGRSVVVSFGSIVKAEIADLGTPLTVSLDAGAFKDMWGNGNAASQALAATVGRDWVRPGFNGASLDLETGDLAATFSEAVYVDRVYAVGYTLHVADQTAPQQKIRVNLRGADVVTDGRYADAVTLRLTAAQRAAVIGAGGPSPDVRITVGGWAFSDYPVGNHGWYFPLPGSQVAVSPDTGAPSNASVPLLDLANGTIRIQFDEHVDRSAFNASGMRAEAANGSSLSLAGAVPAAAWTGRTAVLDLPPPLAAAVRQAYGTGGQLLLTVPNTAFSDLSGNRFAGMARVDMVAVGETGPLLLVHGPRLDLGTGILEMGFDRAVLAPDTLAGVSIGGNGTSPVPLDGAGASLAGTPPSNLSIALTDAQKAGAAAAHRDGGYLTLHVPPTTFSDVHHHRFAGLQNAALQAEPDALPPALESAPAFNVAAGTVSMSFDEYVVLGTVAPGGIDVYNPHRETSLAGAAVSAQGAGGGGVLDAGVVVTLTPLQRALVYIAMHSDPNIYVRVSNSSIFDVSGNAFAGVDTGAPPGTGGNPGSPRAAADPGLPPPALRPGSEQAVPRGGGGDGGALPLPHLPGHKGPIGPAPPGEGTGGGAPMRSSHLSSTLVLNRGADSPVRLDLNTGILEVEFTSWAYLPLTNLTEAAIRAGGVNVTLEGAAVDTSHGLLGFFNETVVINLTAAQKAAVAAAGTEARLVAAVGSFADASRKLSLAMNEAIDITPDTTPPSLVRQGAGGPALDLGAGTVALAYDEHVAEPGGGFDAGLLAVDAGGERMRLDGAQGMDAVNETVTVSLAPDQKARLAAAVSAAAGMGAAATIDVAPGAAADVSGNAAPGAADVPLLVGGDTAAPMLASPPVLNLGTGMLVLDFDEYVAVGDVRPQDVAVADRNGGGSESPSSVASEGDGARILLAFLPAQSDALALSNATAGPLALTIAGSAGIADLSGNPFAGLSGANLTVVDDSTPPALLPGTIPQLDIGAGTVSMMFTEHIPADGIDLSGAAIEDVNGASRIPLAGAAVLPPSGPEVERRTIDDDTLRIVLTPAQRAAVALASLEAGPVRIDVPSSAIADAAGLRFAGLSNAPLGIAPDATPPEIPPGSPPVLDLSSGLLAVPFTEHVDAPGASILGAFLTASGASNAAAPSTIPLAGGAAIVVPAPPGSASLTVRLSAGQLAAVAAAGASSAVNLTVPAGAVSDLSGNPFAGLAGEPIAVVLDEAPPALASLPVIDLDDGTVLITFGEYVDAGAANATGISVAGPGGAGRPGDPHAGPAMVGLEGAAISVHPPPPYGRQGGQADLPASAAASLSILVTMTAEQKAAAAASAASEVSIDGHTASIHDMSGNRYGGIDRGRALVAPDETGPAPASASLDLGAGTLSISFDEHVHAGAAVDPAGLVVAVAPPAGQSAALPPPAAVRVGLDGAAASASENAVTVVLAGDQRAALQDAAGRAAGGAPAISLDIARGFAEDLAGNPMAAARGLAALLVPDRTPPGLAAAGIGPVLNLASGTLTLAFDEYIDAQGVRLHDVSIAGPDGQNRTALGGASLAGIADSGLVTVRLTPGQADAARSLNASAAGRPLVASAAAGAFQDLAGNPSPENLFSGAALSATGEAGRPGLAGMPVLDLANGTVRIAFDRAVEAPLASLRGIYVMGADRTGGATSLAGAEMYSAPGSSEIAVGLTGAQKASIARSYSLTGSEGATIDVSAAAGIADRWRNAFEGLAAEPMDVVPDGAPPGLSGAAVDLSAGTVRLDFDEFVAAGGADPSAVRMASSGGAPDIPLAGARILAAADGPSVLLGMTASQKAAAAAAHAAGSSLSILAGPGEVVSDLSGNAYAGAAGAQPAPADVAADAASPSLDARLGDPVLDLGSGVLTLAFDEHLAPGNAGGAVSLLPGAPGSAPVQLLPLPPSSGSGNRSGPSVESSTAAFQLSPVQKGSLLAGGAGAGAAAAQLVRLDMGPGALADLAGNPSAAALARPVQVVPDSAPPSLDPDLPPALDLGSGALRIAFDEPIDILSSDLSGLSLSASASEGGDAPEPVALSAAHLEPPYGWASSVTVLLTRDERGQLGAGVAAAAAAAGDGASPGVVLRIASGAFADMSGNGIEAAELAVEAAADADPPHLDRSAPPLLHTGASPPSLEFDFDEYVDVSGIDTSGIVLGAAGANLSVPLAGASAYAAQLGPGQQGDGYRVRIPLTDAQASAAASALAGGARLVVDAPEGAFADLAGNAFAGLGGHGVLASGDVAAPAMAASPHLHLGLHVLTLAFGEPVRLAADGLAGIELSGSNGSHRTSLDGALAPPGPSTALRIELGAAQAERAKSALRADGGLAISISAEAVQDLSYNHFAGLRDAHVDAILDARGPELVEAGRHAPSLDLAGGLLTVQFSEAVDAARYNLTGATISRAAGAGGGPPVDLGGATVLAGGAGGGQPSPTTRIAITDLQKSALVGGGFGAAALGQAALLSIPAGAFYDMEGNAAPAVDGAPLAVAPDAAGPSFDSHAAPPVLDLERGILEVRFDEPVEISWPAASGGVPASGPLPRLDIAVFDGSSGGDGRHRVPIAAPPAELPQEGGAASRTISISLDPGQRAALADAIDASALLGFGAGAVLVAGDGLVRDLSGNGLAGYAAGAGGTGGTALAVVPDAAPPALDPRRPPVLDMGSGMLTAWFDEYVVLAAGPAGPAALEIEMNGTGTGTGTVGGSLSLAGASVQAPPADGSEEVVVRLTHDQKAWLAAAGAAGPDARPVLRVGPGAAADLHGNPNAAASAPAVLVRPDAAPPRLEAPPVLNTALGDVHFDLDEFADARRAAPEGLAIENADGSQHVRLAGAGARAVPAGAGLPADYSDRIDVEPAGAQLAAILGYASAGGPAAVRLNMSGAAFEDMAGNAIAPLARAPLTVTDDAGGPDLLSVRVDLGDGDVSLSFNETVDAAGAILSQMRLGPPGGAGGGISLAGASLLLPHGVESDRIELQLSGAQKAAAAAAHAASAPGSGLALAAPPGAVDDAYGNHAGRLNASAAVEPDATPPALLPAHSGRDAPHLDLGTGVLTLRFSEHVATAAIDPSGISVRGASAAGDASGGSGLAVNLAGASVSQAREGPYSDSISIRMAPESKAAAAASVGPRSLAGLLDIGANASVADPSSVGMLPVSGAPLLVRPDRSPPVVDAARSYVDLRDGTVAIAFDEYVEAVDTSRMAVGAQGAADAVSLGSLSAPAAPSDTVVVRMTADQTLAVASLLEAASAGGAEAEGRAVLHIGPGALADASGNRFAGTPAGAGLVPGSTLPPISVIGASVTAPGTVEIEYSHAVESSPEDYALEVDGERRTIAGVSGSGGAVYAVSFEPADARPDAAGTVSIGRLSGPGYLFGGADAAAVSDGQAPSAVSAAAVGASAVSLHFDEPVAGVDASDLAVAGVGSRAVEIAGVSGSGASRLVLVGAPAFAGGASGTIEVLAAGAFEDLAGNANGAPARIDVQPASVSVRAEGPAPVVLTADTVVRNVTGAAPRIDLSAVNGTFPEAGDFAVVVRGAGDAAPSATVVFPAGTSAVSGLPADSVIEFSTVARAVPDRAVIGGGEIGIVVELGRNGTVVFDRPVRIVLPGAAGHAAFWMGADGAVSPIGRCAGGVPDPVPAGAAGEAEAAAAAEAHLGGSGECAADTASGAKVIYTHHFTAFGTVAPPAAREPLPPLAGAAAGDGDGAPAPPPAGACAANLTGCSFEAYDAPSVGGLRPVGPGAAFGGMLYAAGPASNAPLGESLYAIDMGRGGPGAVAASVSEIELRIFDGIDARVDILGVWAGGGAPDPAGAASTPPLLAAAATYQIPVQGAAADGSLSPPVPVLLVIDAAAGSLAGHIDLSYVNHRGLLASAGVPALLDAYAAAGAAYVGMPPDPAAAAGDGAPPATGPILLVNVSDPSAPALVPIYDDDAASPPSPAGYYYPREGWQPTAMAARGTAVYMVGEAWRPAEGGAGAAAAGQGTASQGLHGLHTLSFAAGGTAGAITPRYSLVSSIAAAGEQGTDADPSQYAAIGMAVDPVRSKLYVLYGNGTISVYALDAADMSMPPVPSFLYHLDASVRDPRDLALDAGTGVLYAADGGSVRVYDAAADILVATVADAAAGAAGVSSLVLAGPPPGAAAATVYALPADPSAPVRIVGILGDMVGGGEGDGAGEGGATDRQPGPPPVVVAAPPPAPSAGLFFGGGGGGGGSGGGGSGPTGLAARPDAVVVRSVSWDCNDGTMRIVVASAGEGGGAAPDVAVLSSAGAAAARNTGEASGQGLFTYEAPLPGDGVVSIRAVLADGRAVATASKTVRTDGQCEGEVAFDGGRLPAATSAEAASADAASAPSDASGLSGADAQPDADAEPPASPRTGGAASSDPDAEPAAAPESEAPPGPAAAASTPEPGPPAGEAAQAEPVAPRPDAAASSEAADPADAADAPRPDAAASGPEGGGCLIATAAYGTELAPQVQVLREVRDAAVMSEGFGPAFMASFNTAYYAVSPQVADLEREHPALRDAIRALIAPILHLAGLAAALGQGALAYAAAAAVAVALSLLAAARAAGRADAPPSPARRQGSLGRDADRAAADGAHAALLAPERTCSKPAGKARQARGRTPRTLGGA